ncbi:MAG: helix-turn-helix domain-containing protein [Actinomycetota bacterium]
MTNETDGFEIANGGVTLSYIKSKPTITVEEAGRFTGFSRATAYRAVREGRLPCLRVGRRVVILTKPFLELIGLGEPDDHTAARD